MPTAPHLALFALRQTRAPSSLGTRSTGISGECWFPKVQLWACGTTDPLHGGKGNQQWRVVTVPGGSQIVNPVTRQCLTATEQPGWAVGLDPGVTVVAAQMRECYPPGSAPNQTFQFDTMPVAGGSAAANGGVGEAGEPFAIRSTMNGLCLQPELERLPHFDAVAFAEPGGAVSVVVLNTNDRAITLTLRDAAANAAVEHSVPPHAIHTYRWTPDGEHAHAPPAQEKLVAAAPHTGGGAQSTSRATTFLVGAMLCGLIISVAAVDRRRRTGVALSIKDEDDDEEDEPYVDFQGREMRFAK